MRMTWNAENEARLVLGIIAQVPGARLDYKALASFMGPGCSVAALQHHIFKLRREAGIPVNSPGKARHAQTSTPNKSKQAGALQTPIEQAKNPYYVVDDDDDDDDQMKMDVKPIFKEEEDKKLNKLKRSFVEISD
ncbi:hypothetical protein BJX76DRAFT_134295 [Aspergillus varians]